MRSWLSFANQGVRTRDTSQVECLRKAVLAVQDGKDSSHFMDFKHQMTWLLDSLCLNQIVQYHDMGICLGAGNIGSAVVLSGSSSTPAIFKEKLDDRLPRRVSTLHDRLPHHNQPQSSSLTMR